MFFKILLTKRERSVFDVLSSSSLSISNFLGILGTFIYVLATYLFTCLFVIVFYFHVSCF